MPRKTRIHDRCPPSVLRDRHSVAIALSVLLPDGRPDMLIAPVSPTQAAHMAAELLAFVSHHLADQGRGDASA